MEEKKELIVITGGPGAGKTSLLRELETRGYACAQEVAREIIRDEVATNGSALPWADRLAFAEQMLDRSVQQWRDLQAGSCTVFVDRGLPDTLCYARLVGLPERFQQKALAYCREFRYDKRVLLAPAWEEIYVTDTERKQSFEEAVATVEMMAQTYRDCGYSLLELPRVSVQQRAEFVLEAISAR